MTNKKLIAERRKCGGESEGIRIARLAADALEAVDAKRGKEQDKHRPG